MKAKYAVALGALIAIAAGIVGLATGLVFLVVIAVVGLVLAVGGGLWSGWRLSRRGRHNAESESR